ncbi:MAG: flagellar FliJ family protein [Candidatus Acidiferrum sp.]
MARRADQREMAIVSHGASLQFAAICEVAALHARQQLEAQLERAERKRLFQLQEYQAARQKREILQCIMQRQKEAYDLEFARHEQQTADEVFLFSFHVLSNQ